MTGDPPPERREFIHHIKDYFSQWRFYFGAADIFCCGRFNAVSRAGDLVFLLSMVHGEDGKRVITEFTVVIPPHGSDDLSMTEEDVRSGFADSVARNRGRPLDENEKAVAAKMLKVIQAPDLQIRSAIQIIEGARMHSTIIFSEAARYRDETVVLPPAGEKAQLEEHKWTVFLKDFAERAVAAAKKAECYVALDTGELRPHNQKNIDILTSVFDCGVLCTETDNDPSALIAKHADEWLANARAGRIGAVLTSIDGLPASMNSHKGALKAQMFHQAGLSTHAIDIIQDELATHPDMDGELRVKFAIIAEKAGEFDLAVTLLEPAIPMLRTQEWLEVALELGRKLEDSALQQACAERLESSFPDSHDFHRYKLRALLHRRDYPAIKSMLENPPAGITPDVAAFYRKVVAAFSVAEQPDYQAFLADVAANQSNFVYRAKLACVDDARTRGLLKEALQLATPVERTGPTAKPSAWVLLRIVEQLLLSRNEVGGLGIDPAKLQEPVLELIHYLAANPVDGETRLALAKLLSVQMTGTYGMPIIALATIALAEHGSTIVDSSELAGILKPVPEFEDIKPFFQEAISWLGRETPIVLGRTVLPAELLTVPADDVVSVLTKFIDYTGSRLVDDTDFNFIEQLLAVAVATAPHSSKPDVDLILIRHVAGAYAIAGRVQRARDFAENLLLLSVGTNPKRIRMAWFGFADIYHRLNNETEALVAMACALACEGEISSEQAWYETHVLIRLLRDLNMTAAAASLLPLGKALIQRLGLESEFAHRFETIALGILFRELMTKSHTPKDIRDFIEAAARNCEDVIRHHDELSPIAVLLAQAIRFSELHGIQVSEYARQTLGRVLLELGDPGASMIRTLSEAAPKAADVLALVARLEGARHSDDTGYDVHFITIAAKRLLDSQESKSDPQIAAFAIELLADHGIARPRSHGTAPLSSLLPAALERPAEIAKDISRAGADVHVMGLSESKALVHVIAKDGTLRDVVVESPETFSKDALDAWSRQFPFNYGFERSDSNIFHTSMGGLGLSALDSARAVFVMDTSLQQLPPNLLLASDDFIGRKIATATAPSLSWLNDVQTRVPALGGSAAWIPIAASESADRTLAMVKDRLDETFTAHGIAVDTNPAIPEALEGLELTIITAHGGIVPEGRFFQVVADDADMKISAAALSRAVRNVGLVILFVCSAGRFDKHPMASTTVGLTKQLLDQGCSTVIASPWPLHASVPAYWLPTFLDAWSSGLPAIDANFEANKAVEGAMGDFPAYCLAMSVFGNPFQKKSRA
jgi:hypothetical protein